jgi:hypothetical protein
LVKLQFIPANLTREYCRCPLLARFLSLQNWIKYKTRFVIEPEPPTMHNNYFLLPFFLLALQFSSFAQEPAGNNGSGYATVVAGKEYQASGFKQLFLGKHYRKEWTTPVRVKVLNLDTLGGLTPTEQGGGRQTKTLRLKSAKGKEYVLRSIDKDYGRALPEIAHDTFIERMAKDQVSTAHPFAAITVPPMAEAAGLFHTNPIIVLVPSSPRLGEFNDRFANTLCLFEERPDDNQEDAPNFGYSKDVVSTAKMYEKIYEKNDHRVDQQAFVRARLFDIFLGDWGRHDDQWRWAKFQEDGKTIYKPVPRDRDQAYTMFDGIIPFIGTTPEELEHLKSFKGKIKNIKKYNFPARYIDRQLTNEMPEDVWINTAKDLQSKLTDAVIEQSLQQLPPELFSISGNTIITKLKQRRNDLVYYATKYYKWLNKEVEIVGTKQSELFLIDRLSNNETSIRIFDLDKEGQPKKSPFYSRVFNNHTTSEIRLYGLAGNDVYRVNGKVHKGMKLRIIGGVDKDSITDNSSVTGIAHKTLVYDNPGNEINTSAETRVRLQTDSSINAYDYHAFIPNSGHTVKSPSYSNVRGIYFNVGYTYRKYHWRKEPFSWEQTLKANYSFSNKSIGGNYDAVFNQLIGKLNLLINGRYDEKLSHYYYGTGNETSAASLTDYHYFRLPVNEAAGRIGLQREFSKHHSFTISGNYEMYRVVDDTGNYVTHAIPLFSDVYSKKSFIGGDINYILQHLDNDMLPTKGVNFEMGAGYRQNIKKSAENFEKYGASLGFYIPLSKSFTMVVKGGGSTISGTPQIYQLNWIGGGQTLRGYRRERFHGKSAFYNENELRWAFNAHTFLFNGKMGLVGFVDDGRVWNPGEASNKWHVGYGGGFFVSPFNKVVVGLNYGISDDGKVFHLRFGKLL